MRALHQTLPGSLTHVRISFIFVCRYPIKHYLLIFSPEILPKQINTPIFWTAEDWKAVFSLDSPYEANFAFLLANVARTYILLFSILVVVCIASLEITRMIA